MLDPLEHAHVNQKGPTLHLDVVLDDVSNLWNRFIPSNWSLILRAWAGVSAATAGVHNYHGALAVRLLLGFCEAPFYPGAIYLLSLFYTRREIATRVSILYSKTLLLGHFQAP